MFVEIIESIKQLYIKYAKTLDVRSVKISAMNTAASKSEACDRKYVK